MSMRLYAYRILVDGWKPSTELTEKLYNNLVQLPKRKDVNNWEYTVGQIYKSDFFIYGILGQEADELGFEYDDSKTKVEFDKYTWYDTFFVIDIEKANIFIHKYKYKPNNLSHKKTIKRLEDILSTALFKELQHVIKIMPYREGISASEFKKIFYKYTIHETKFSNIRGHSIPEGSKLHNPNEALDEIRRLSHNSYDAKILNTALLDAAEGENLSKSPTARSLLEAGSEGDKITYTDESGQRNTEYKETKAFLTLNDTVDDYNPEKYFDTFKRKLYEKIDTIKRYKLFEGVEDIFNIRNNDQTHESDDDIDE